MTLPRRGPGKAAVFSQSALEQLLFGDHPERYEPFLARGVVSAATIANMIMSAGTGPTAAEAMLKAIETIHLDIAPLDATQLRSLVGIAEKIGQPDLAEASALALASSLRLPLLMPKEEVHKTAPPVAVRWI